MEGLLSEGSGTADSLKVDYIGPQAGQQSNFVVRRCESSFLMASVLSAN